MSAETMTITMESETTVRLTPQVLASVFWNMSDDQQADFFAALAEEIERNRDPKAASYSLGEMQWWYMHRRLQERKGKALSVYLALSAPAFEFSRAYCGLIQKSEEWA